MIILAVRVEMDLIFKNSYPVFFSEPPHEAIASKLINDVITKLLDPNLYLSRFSFLESDSEAINLKCRVAIPGSRKPSTTYKEGGKGKVESSAARNYTRSALVSSLFPNPADGKVRALFGSSKRNFEMNNRITNMRAATAGNIGNRRRSGMEMRGGGRSQQMLFED